MRASVPAGIAAGRSVVRGLVGVVVVIGVVAGCDGYCLEVSSLAPAVPSEDRIEVPAIVGHWESADTASQESGTRDRSSVDIRLLAGRTPEYLIQYTNVTRPDSGPAGAVDEPARPAWFEGHIGRVGDFQLIEIRAVMAADSNTAVPDSADETFIRALYHVARIEVDSSAIRWWSFSADTVVQVLQDRRCPGAFYSDSQAHVGHIVLTGTSREVGAFWACVGALPGVWEDSVVLRRR